MQALDNMIQDLRDTAGKMQIGQDLVDEVAWADLMLRGLDHGINEAYLKQHHYAIYSTLVKEYPFYKEAKKLLKQKWNELQIATWRTVLPNVKDPTSLDSSFVQTMLKKGDARLLLPKDNSQIQPLRRFPPIKTKVPGKPLKKQSKITDNFARRKQKRDAHGKRHFVLCAPGRTTDTKNKIAPVRKIVTRPPPMPAPAPADIPVPTTSEEWSESECIPATRPAKTLTSVRWRHIAIRSPGDV